MAWNLEEAITYYKRQGAPGDQSAMISLLREIQQENGGIPSYMLKEIAASYGIKEGLMLALIKRIPSLRLKDTHTLELCAGPNCGKHTALAAFAEKLCKESAGKMEVKFMPCMRMCAKGPNVRLDGKVFHAMTEEKLLKLLKEIL